MEKIDTTGVNYWSLESDPDFEEDIGNPNSPLEQHTKTRREKFLEGIIVNKKEWIKNLSGFVKAVYRTRETKKISFDIPLIYYKRIVRIIENNSRKFQTISDLLRHMFIPALDIAEEVWMGDKEVLKLNKYFKMMDIADEIAEQESVAQHIISTMRKVHEGFLAKTMSEKTYLKKIDKLVDSSGDDPEVQRRVEDIKLHLLSETGMKEEREKFLHKLSQRKYRAKQSHLRLVEPEENPER